MGTSWEYRLNNLDYSLAPWEDLGLQNEVRSKIEEWEGDIDYLILKVLESTKVIVL